MLHGRYSLLEEIGRGRSGVVRRGFDHVLKRDVAVKTMADTPQARWEMQLLGLLDHPNIVAFYDVIIHKGQIHLVMELASGGTVRQKRLTVDELVQIGLEAAGALQYLHELGFIHGDLKPSHLVFDNQGRVKLVDWGSSTTIGGPNMGGTLEYMAPEQAHCERSRSSLGDPRMDVYGLGKALINLARENKLRLPKELGDVLKRATSSSIQSRFQSMDEFAEHLEYVPNSNTRSSPSFIRGLAAAMFTFGLLVMGFAGEVYPAFFITFLGPAIVGLSALYSPVLAAVSLVIVILPALFI